MKNQALPLILTIAAIMQPVLALPNIKSKHNARAKPAAKRTDYSTEYPTCNSTLYHRKPWTSLTSDEKESYFTAEHCLMETPTKLDLSNMGVNETTKTLWDDLQWTHIVLTNDVHSDGQFLPWHRYFLHLHESFLRNDCNYTGPMPYWNETADLQGDNMNNSVLLQADAFGGDGQDADETVDRCVVNGKFANTTLRMHAIGDGNDEYCLYRDFQNSWMQYESKPYIDACTEETSYADFYDCLASFPHGAGHEVIGGVMGDVSMSPGDPMFFLHHSWIDAIWWKWQLADPDNRLYDIGGQNYEDATTLEIIGEPAPPSVYTDYDGDDGNVTTLNHNLFVNNLIANTTVGHVMDLRTQVLCSTYDFDAW